MWGHCTKCDGFVVPRNGSGSLSGNVHLAARWELKVLTGPLYCGWPGFERHELDPDPPTCAQMAEAAGRKAHEVENALKAARVAFAKILREKVTETVADPSRVEEELQALAEAMG